MKKILLSFIAISGIFTGVKAQVVLGPEAGASIYSMTQKFNGSDRSNNQQVGFRGGLSADIPVVNQFSIQPGVYFNSNIGSKGNYSRSGYTAGGVPSAISDDREYHINQITVPVYFVYKSSSDWSAIRFFAGAGPYASFNIGGHFNEKVVNNLNGYSYTQVIDQGINIGNNEIHDNVRVFDFGGNITAGVQFPFGGFVRAYYGMGFFNLKPQGDGDNSFKTFGGGLTVGFWFNPSGNHPL